MGHISYVKIFPESIATFTSRNIGDQFSWKFKVSQASTFSRPYFFPPDKKNGSVLEDI